MSQKGDSDLTNRAIQKRVLLTGTHPSFHALHDRTMSSAQEKKNHEAQLVEDLGIGPGTLPDEVYDMSMAWWRAGIRRALVRNLRSESRWLADMQVCCFDS
jgi:hypothetical protein